MLILHKKWLYFIMIAVMLVGCSTKAVMVSKNVQADPVDKSNGIFSNGPSDKELFEDALSSLSNNKNQPNYSEVKVRLEKFVTQFPKSKWVAGAQALIYSLDKISELQVQLKQEKQKTQSEYVKLTKEIEGLKDNVKQTEEKYSAEITRLQQENEQYKKDIQQLKNLEIQLEKREKMLR